MPPRITFHMDEKTKKVLKESMDLLTVDELAFSAGIAADIIAEEARLRVPVKTGDLKRGIVARKNKEASAFTGKGTAYVGANYKIAPHAHLVEYGARGGQMPANPFMRNAIASKRGEAMAAMEKDIISRITKKLERL